MSILDEAVISPPVADDDLLLINGFFNECIRAIALHEKKDPTPEDLLQTCKELEVKKVIPLGMFQYISDVEEAKYLALKASDTAKYHVLKQHIATAGDRYEQLRMRSHEPSLENLVLINEEDITVFSPEEKRLIELYRYFTEKEATSLSREELLKKYSPAELDTFVKEKHLETFGDHYHMDDLDGEMDFFQERASNYIDEAMGETFHFAQENQALVTCLYYKLNASRRKTSYENWIESDSTIPHVKQLMIEVFPHEGNNYLKWHMVDFGKPLAASYGEIFKEVTYNGHRIDIDYSWQETENHSLIIYLKKVIVDKTKMGKQTKSSHTMIHLMNYFRVLAQEKQATSLYVQFHAENKKLGDVLTRRYKAIGNLPEIPRDGIEPDIDEDLSTIELDLNYTPLSANPFSILLQQTTDDLCSKEAVSEVPKTALEIEIEDQTGCTLEAFIEALRPHNGNITARLLQRLFLGINLDCVNISKHTGYWVKHMGILKPVTGNQYALGDRVLAELEYKTATLERRAEIIAASESSRIESPLKMPTIDFERHAEDERLIDVFQRYGNQMTMRDLGEEGYLDSKYIYNAVLWEKLTPITTIGTTYDFCLGPRLMGLVHLRAQSAKPAGDIPKSAFEIEIERQIGTTPEALLLLIQQNGGTITVRELKARYPHFDGGCLAVKGGYWVAERMNILEPTGVKCGDYVQYAPTQQFMAEVEFKSATPERQAELIELFKRPAVKLPSHKLKPPADPSTMDELLIEVLQAQQDHITLADLLAKGHLTPREVYAAVTLGKLTPITTIGRSFDFCLGPKLTALLDARKASSTKKYMAERARHDELSISEEDLERMSRPRQRARSLSPSRASDCKEKFFDILDEFNPDNALHLLRAKHYLPFVEEHTLETYSFGNFTTLMHPRRIQLELITSPDDTLVRYTVLQDHGHCKPDALQHKDVKLGLKSHHLLHVSYLSYITSKNHLFVMVKKIAIDGVSVYSKHPPKAEGTLFALNHYMEQLAKDSGAEKLFVQFDPENKRLGALLSTRYSTTLFNCQYRLGVFPMIELGGPKLEAEPLTTEHQTTPIPDVSKVKSSADPQLSKSPSTDIFEEAHRKLDSLETVLDERIKTLERRPPIHKIHATPIVINPIVPIGSRMDHSDVHIPDRQFRNTLNIEKTVGPVYKQGIKNPVIPVGPRVDHSKTHLPDRKDTSTVRQAPSSDIKAWVRRGAELDGLSSQLASDQAKHTKGSAEYQRIETERMKVQVEHSEVLERIKTLRGGGSTANPSQPLQKTRGRIGAGIIGSGVVSALFTGPAQAGANAFESMGKAFDLPERAQEMMPDLGASTIPTVIMGAAVPSSIPWLLGFSALHIAASDMKRHEASTPEGRFAQGWFQSMTDAMSIPLSPLTALSQAYQSPSDQGLQLNDILNANGIISPERALQVIRTRELRLSEEQKRISQVNPWEEIKKAFKHSVHEFGKSFIKMGAALNDMGFPIAADEFSYSPFILNEKQSSEPSKATAKATKMGREAFIAALHTAEDQKMPQTTTRKPKKAPAAKEFKKEHRNLAHSQKEHDSAERIRLLDAAAAHINEQFPNDARTEGDYLDYLNSQPTEAARVRALKRFQDKTQRYHRDDVSGLLNGMSNFLNQVQRCTTNKEVKMLAGGLDALNKFRQGMETMSDAMKSGVSTIASSGKSADAAAMILSGILTIWSLCQEEDEGDGLSEAFQAIHSQLRELTQEMRQNFQITWQRLDAIVYKLDKMERNNVYRFLNTLHVIDSFKDMTMERFKRVHCELYALHGNVDHVYRSLKSYLDTLNDANMKIAVGMIRLQSEEEIIADRYKHSATLAHWLSDAAATTGRSGYIPREYGKLSITSQDMVSKITSANAPEQQSQDALLLGLFGSIAHDADPNILSEQELPYLVSPQHWFKALRVYTHVVRLGMPKILSGTPAQRAGYLEQLHEIKRVPETTLNLYAQLRASTNVWETLEKNYVAALNDVQQQIKTIVEKHRQALNRQFQLDPAWNLLRLDGSARDAIRRLDTKPELKTALKNQFYPHGFLKKMGVTADDRLALELPPEERGAYATPKPGVLPEDNGALSPTQIEIVTREQNTALYEFLNDSRFLLARAFLPEKVDLDLSCYVQKTMSSDWWNEPGGRHRVDEPQGYCVSMVMSMTHQGIRVPFSDVNLFMHVTQPYKMNPVNPGVLHQYYEDHSNWWKNPASTTYVSRPEMKAYDRNQLLTSLDQLLAERRTLLRDDLLENLDLTRFEAARLQLLSMIQLLCPDFKIDVSRDIKTQWSRGFRSSFRPSEQQSSGLKELLYQLSSVHRQVTAFSPTSLSTLLSTSFSEKLLLADGIRMTKGSLKPEFWDYADYRDKKYIREIIDASQLSQLRIWRDMTQAMAALNMLERDLSQNAARPEILEQERIEALFDTTMTELSAHHQTVGDALSSLKKTATQLRPLASTMDKSMMVRINEADHILEEAFSRLDGTMYDADVLSDEMSSTYVMPSINAEPEKPAVTLSPETRELLRTRWKTYLTSSDIPLDETITLIAHFMAHLRTISHVRVPAILFMGRSGVGKSTSVNACLGVDYQLAENDTGFTIVKPIHDDVVEPAKVSHEEESETLVPQLFMAHEDADYCLIDTAGFLDNRGKAFQISNGIAMQALATHLQEVKGIVITVEERDVEDPKYLLLGMVLAQVGRLLPEFKEGINNHVVLEITKPSGRLTPTQLLTRLKAWAKKSYPAGASLSPEQQAIQRALSYVTQSEENIAFVDVTNRESVSAFRETLDQLPVSDIDLFDFTPSSDNITLIKTLIQRLIDVKHELEIKRLTHQQAIQHIAANALDQCAASLPEAYNNAFNDIDALSEIDQLMKEQSAIVTTITGAIGSMQSLLKPNRHVPSSLVSGDAETIGLALLETHTELEFNQTLFEDIGYIAELFSIKATQADKSHSRFFSRAPQHAAESSAGIDRTGYETDRESEKKLNRDSKAYCHTHTVAVDVDSDDDSDDEAEEKPAWVRSEKLFGEEAIGQRILRKKYSSLAKDPRFFSFLRKEGHHLINEDETLVAQLPLTKTG